MLWESSVFKDVGDTPMFREKVGVFELEIDVLRDSCNKLAKEAVKYCDALEMMAKTEENFANALRVFAPANDLESMEFCGINYSGCVLKISSSSLGVNEFTKFSDVLFSLAEHRRCLHREVVHHLLEPLNSIWVGQLCSDISRYRHLLDTKQKMYDNARYKYLSLKKFTKKELVKKVEDELKKIKGEAENARYAIARKYSEVGLKRSYEFLEMISAFMDSHFIFFEKGCQKLKNLKTDIIANKKKVADRKSNTEQELMSLEKIIEDQEEHERILTEAVDDANLTDVTNKGPLQMSSHNQSLEIDESVQASLISRGQAVVTLKQGYLLKRSSNMRGDWKKRFFKLDSRGIFHYDSKKGEATKRYLRLLTCSVKDCEEEDLRFCFIVVSPEKSFTLQADNEFDKQEWIRIIQRVIHCLLNSSESLPDYENNVSSSSSSASQLRIKAHSTCFDPLDASRSRHSFSEENRKSLKIKNIGGSMMTGPLSSREYRTHEMMSRAPTFTSPFHRIRKIKGNDKCADCGAPDPEWTSLNLGVLICIECSGIHRKLGVHISKVRSLKLDVRVWTEPLIEVFLSMGNNTLNDIWEAEIKKNIAISHKCGDETWNKESDQEEGSVNNKTSDNNEDWNSEAFRKPDCFSPLAEKEIFVWNKYSEKKYVERPSGSAKLNTTLWNSVFRENIKGVYKAIVKGADINLIHETTAAYNLVQQINIKVFGDHNDLKMPNKQGAPVLLIACRSGNLPIIELLLQNGAELSCQDTQSRGVLHYAVCFGHKSVIKYFVDRGAELSAKDKDGFTALDLAEKLLADDQVRHWLTQKGQV